MPTSHVNDELLDRYALGTLPEEHLAEVEEHLLRCEACQSHLEASDEFTMLFRAAAVQPDARPQSGWRLSWNHRPANWTLAAAVTLATLLLVVGPLRNTSTPLATVFLESLRGPDAAAQVTAGQPALLVFDVVPASGAGAYAASIVNPVGIQVLAPTVTSKDGRLAVLVDRLPPGSYWLRVLRTDSREPIAEYRLQAR